MRRIEVLGENSSDLALAVTAMDAFMQERGYNNAMVPAQLIVELWQSGQITTLADFEAALRAQQSRIYLIATPLNNYGKGYTIAYPKDTLSGKPKYALYIVVNGPEEAEQKRVAEHITVEENMSRLLATGLLQLQRTFDD